MREHVRVMPSLSSATTNDYDYDQTTDDCC